MLLPKDLISAAISVRCLRQCFLPKQQISLIRHHAKRGIAAAAVQSQTLVFDKRQRIIHLDRSSASEDAHIYDYIRDFVAKDFCDRIDDVKQESSEVVLNLGSCSGLIAKSLNPTKVDTFIQADISRNSLYRCKRNDTMLSSKFPIQYLQCDEEFLPLKSNSVGLVLSCLSLHWINDLVKCFRQVNDILSDNKPFVGVLFGGETLYELRSALQLAELERLSGFSSHVAPKTTGQDVARLLQGCGFQMITVDISEVKINYPSMFELMFDLQGMGENNCSMIGSRHMHRDVLEAAASVYQVLYGSDDHQKGVPATFQAIHFIAWKNPKKATPLRNK